MLINTLMGVGTIEYHSGIFTLMSFRNNVLCLVYAYMNCIHSHMAFRCSEIAIAYCMTEQN